MKLRVLDLFSGIGGFSLGLERTGGFETVAFCEIEEFPRRVLAKHWPSVPIYTDVRTLTHERLRNDGITVDVICGGFPCQDISLAGKGAGLAGERSGLWSEFARLIGEIRPRYVLVENVAALLSRGLGDVLGDLAALGYDAEWHCIPASAVGAHHRRDRLWIVAYPNRDRELQPKGRKQEERGRACDSRKPMAHAREHESRRRDAWLGWRICCQGDVEAEYHRNRSTENGIWRAEPDMDRVANGVPDGVDRLAALGNAVVPQIPEILGRAILAAEVSYVSTG